MRSSRPSYVQEASKSSPNNTQCSHRWASLAVRRAWSRRGVVSAIIGDSSTSATLSAASRVRGSPAAPSSTRSVRRRSGSSVHQDRAGALAQELLRAVADVLENLGDRADTVYRPGGLPHPDGVDVGIFLEDRRERVERRQLLSAFSYL